MNIPTVILAGIALFCCGNESSNSAASKNPQDNGTTVTVMTYNIYGARRGGLSVADLQAIADVIKRADPDIVALQEVDKNTNRNAANGDIAKKLGELTGMGHFFAKAMDHDGGEYGDAVLSKLPIKEKKGYHLGVVPELGGEPRSVARILVEKDGKAFYFVSTHFDHLRDDRNRVKQANDFVALAKTFSKPVIVGADFNARPDSGPMDILRTHFANGCPDGNCDQFTFSTDNPRTTIDYLIYAPHNAFSVRRYGAYTSADKESDHFPVLATFRLEF